MKRSLVLIGDSIASGLGASTPEHTLGYYFHHHFNQQDKKGEDLVILAVPGAKLQDVVEKQLPVLDSLSAVAVLIFVGSNDIIKRTTARQFRRLFRALITQLRQSRYPILISTIPDLTLTPKFPKRLKFFAYRKITIFNLIIRQECTKLTNITIFDFFHISQKYLRHPERYLSEDQFHPNDHGYATLAMHAIEALGQMPLQQLDS